MSTLLRDTILELIALAILVSISGELLVSGLVDIIGVCPFDSTVCNGIQIQGAIKLLFMWICTSAAVAVCFVVMVSKLNGDE